MATLRRSRDEAEVCVPREDLRVSTAVAAAASRRDGKDCIAEGRRSVVMGRAVPTRGVEGWVDGRGDGVVGLGMSVGGDRGLLVSWSEGC